MQRCSVCGEDASASDSYQHRECLHSTHTDCLDLSKANYAHCTRCLGGDAADAPAQVISEPKPTDGVDYVLYPGERAAGPSLVGSLLGKLRGGGAQGGAVAPSPLDLLANHVPVETLMSKHKVGMQHILKCGGDIMDFLGNGYTWSDLLKFEDVGKRGPERAAQTLQALSTNASHFRVYRDQLPWAKIREHAQLENVDLGDRFGLAFPPNGGPLQCLGDEDWNAATLAKLGVSMDDLFAMGLGSIDQYQHLMRGLNDARAAQMEKTLGVTEEHILRLIPPPAPAPAPTPTPAPVAVAAPHRYAAPEPEPLVLPPQPRNEPEPRYMKLMRERIARHGTAHLIK